MMIKVLLRRFLWGCAGCLLLSLAGCRAGTTENKIKQGVKKEAADTKQQLPNIHKANLTDSELSGTDDAGNLMWKVTAKKAQAAADKGIKTAQPDAQLTDATAVLYQKGKPQSHFEAPRILLRYQPEGGVRLLMSGGVTATSKGNKTGGRGPVHLKTPKATVNVKKRQLWTNSGVTMTQGDGGEKVTVTSKTLLASTSLQTADIGGGTKTATSRGTMTAQSAHWNWQNGQFSAHGKVHAKGQDMTIDGAKMRGNTNTHQVTVWGGITAKNAKGSATASKAIYHWDSGKLTASGNVTLHSNGTTVSAASLETTRAMQQADARGGVKVVKGDMTITANTAHVTKVSGGNTAVSGSGNVRVASPRGHAKASRASWKNSRINASGNVALSRAGYVLYGNSLSSDDQFTDATLTGNVHGALAGGGSMSAGKVHYIHGKMIATGGVRGSRGDLRLRADRLESDADGKTLQLRGDVTLKNARGTTVQAPKATYNRAKNQVYAWGGVTLHDPSREITQKGKTLTANLALKKAVLTDVAGSGKMNVLKGKGMF